ncbi:hypothetical protein BG015_001384 [Linnemannia schmuckeri]|uniref:Uncharacterized protein n=1 Tax=Linnemannia schmuckeri TaxID=64567 RepID=A0A9P5VDU5_9FUNG|nr:hypothetical protein BG015_001384 [Linnemannia schmuckeri]
MDKRSYITLEDAIQTPWASFGIEIPHIRVEVETVTIGRLAELRSLRLLTLPSLDQPRTGIEMYIQHMLPGFLTLNPRPDEEIIPAQDTNQDFVITSTDTEAAAAADSEEAIATQPSPPIEVTDLVAPAASAIPKQVDTFCTEFLCHLKGLAKLHDLQDLFHVNTNMFSDLKIEWIRIHWPELRMLEFCSFGNSTVVDDLPALMGRIRDGSGTACVHILQREKSASGESTFFVFFPSW